ncbi:MAG: hypothetical protein PHS14_16550 [Elusimicrobia bacterium]|nr:hypothetical protein [Elusimicrobiota bacterium]
MKPTPNALYLTDNGAALCYEHLGASAKYTGCDLSGQPILKVTTAVKAENAECGYPAIKCEQCGKAA